MVSIVKDIGELWPPFATLIKTLLANCKARGAMYRPTETYRSNERQRWLYAQGRTRPGKIVTGIKENGMHRYRIAADFVRYIEDSVSWAAHEYVVLGEEAEKLGLTWGGRWAMRDLAHVQLLPVIMPDGQSSLTKLRGGWYPKEADYISKPPQRSDWQVLYDWLYKTIPEAERVNNPVMAAINRLRKRDV